MIRIFVSFPTYSWNRLRCFIYSSSIQLIYFKNTGQLQQFDGINGLWGKLYDVIIDKFLIILIARFKQNNFKSLIYMSASLRALSIEIRAALWLSVVHKCLYAASIHKPFYATVTFWCIELHHYNFGLNPFRSPSLIWRIQKQPYSHLSDKCWPLQLILLLHFKIFLERVFHWENVRQQDFLLSLGMKCEQKQKKSPYLWK